MRQYLISPGINKACCDVSTKSAQKHKPIQTLTKLHLTFHLKIFKRITMYTMRALLKEIIIINQNGYNYIFKKSCSKLNQIFEMKAAHCSPEQSLPQCNCWQAITLPSPIPCCLLLPRSVLNDLDSSLLPADGLSTPISFKLPAAAAG